MKQTALTCATGFALVLAACSSSDPAPREDVADDAVQASQTQQAEVAEPASNQPVAPQRQTLALEGLGDLAIGQPVPAGSSFASRGDQLGNDCLTYNSPDYPGVYAMAVDGEVRRITASKGSPVKLVEGIGAGSTLAQVRAAFPGFTETAHKYWGKEGKYLTQPGNDPRLMFEIDPEGVVAHVHVGVMPELAYVEGCA